MTTKTYIHTIFRFSQWQVDIACWAHILLSGTSINSPIHRRERYSQSTENMETRRTNLHKPQQLTSRSSMSTISNANAKR
jgi:hypothetical protein